MTTDSTSSTALDLKVLTRPQLLAGGSMVAVAVAAFLPWMSLFGISVIGFRGDGKITLIAALAGLASLAFGSDVVGRKRMSENASFAVSGIAAALVVMIGLSDMNAFAAFGLYLTLLAGITWVVALAWEGNLLKKARENSAAI